MRVEMRHKNLNGDFCFQQTGVDILILPAKYNWKPWILYIKQPCGDSERGRGDRLAGHVDP